MCREIMGVLLVGLCEGWLYLPVLSFFGFEVADT